MHGVDGQFLSDGGRDEKEGHVRTVLTCQGERRHAVESRDRIVRQDEIRPAFFEGRHKCLTRVDTLRLAGDVALDQGGRNEFRVDRIVLEVEYAERSFHGSFVERLLVGPEPSGGGSLITPQKTPSSFTAVMNW